MELYLFRSLDNRFLTWFIFHSASIQMRDKTQDLALNPSLSLRSKFIVPYRNFPSSINSSGRQKYSFSQVLTTVSHSIKLLHWSPKVPRFYRNSSSYSHSCQSVVLNYEKMQLIQLMIRIQGTLCATHSHHLEPIQTPEVAGKFATGSSCWRFYSS